MNEKVLKSLFDIKLAIQEINSFLPSDGLSFVEYKSNLILKRAIERNLEIIGEAMNRIIREEPYFPINEAFRIVGLRNQIIHAYDSISDENIWASIINHIPKLKVEVDRLTKEFE
jgi:uncharacterized protein with HEPN domain